MIGTLIVSHGKMAEGILDSIELVLGPTDGIDTASLVAGQDFGNFRENVVEKIKALDQGDGVLVFVDVFGASPYNAAMLSYQQLKESGTEIRVITGMNLPMIMESLMSRDTMSLDALAESTVESGRDSIQTPSMDLLQENNSSEDDGDY